MGFATVSGLICNEVMLDRGLAPRDETPFPKLHRKFHAHGPADRNPCFDRCKNVVHTKSRSMPQRSVQISRMRAGRQHCPVLRAMLAFMAIRNEGTHFGPLKANATMPGVRLRKTRTQRAASSRKARLRQVPPDPRPCLEQGWTDNTLKRCAFFQARLAASGEWPTRDQQVSGSHPVFNSLFREEAAASRNQRQQLDHLLQISAPHERWLLAVFGVVLTAVAAWLFLGSLERAVTGDGFLIQPGERVNVSSTEPGHLLE